MPLAAYQEVTYFWSLGKILCDIWTSFDVLCCTASILHLVAIALDRFWAITNVDYAAKRTAKRIFTMIFMIWSVAVITAVSPHIFGLGFDEKLQKNCQLTDNLTYQLFSTLAAFYLPLVVMCIIYWKIFQSAKFRIRKKAFSATQSNHLKSNSKASIRKSSPQTNTDLPNSQSKESPTNTSNHMKSSVRTNHTSKKSNAKNWVMPN